MVATGKEIFESKPGAGGQRGVRRLLGGSVDLVDQTPVEINEHLEREGGLRTAFTVRIVQAEEQRRDEGGHCGATHLGGFNGFKGMTPTRLRRVEAQGLDGLTLQKCNHSFSSR